MPIITVTATIPAGQSLSSAADCTDGRELRILTPPAWTTAPLSFQVSTDGTTFRDAHALNGKPIAALCRAGRAIVIQSDEAAAQFKGHIKFRSGPSHAPVPQAAARTFTVAIEK